MSNVCTIFRTSQTKLFEGECSSRWCEIAYEAWKFRAYNQSINSSNQRNFVDLIKQGVALEVKMHVLFWINEVLSHRRDSSRRKFVNIRTALT